MTRLITYAVLCSLICAFPSGQLVAGETTGKTRKDTGLSDPTVNPGQGSGMRVVRGEVKQASPKTIIVEDSTGKETTMSVDAGTAGDRDVRPGDIITGTITGQGRAVAIHKESASADR
jgi:hypothetical protein